MKHTFTFLFSLTLISFNCAKAQAIEKTDSLALVDLYNSTNGYSWANHEHWLTGLPVAAWYGVTVSCNRVTALDLGVNNLDGKLPSSFSDLSALQYLYLYNNNLRGSFPSFSESSNLKELLMGSNFFTGSIPSSLGKLKDLQQLDLSNNLLSGQIPLAIGNLENAQYINLNNNKLTGRIPVTISNLGNVHILEMADNQLIGQIPFGIGYLSNLQYLYLQNNKLSGTIPSSVGNLQNLQVMYIDNNRLNGSLASTIGNLVNLQLLSLSHNQLKGSVPASFGNLSSLSQLYLSHNELHGALPSSLFKLGNLQYLYLDHNHLKQDINKTPVYPVNVSLHADISHNDFTFDGMEFLATHYPFVTYSPQASLSIHKHGETMSLDAGGTLSNNSYTWYQIEDKSSIAVKGDSSFHPVAGGHYYAQVRNAVATQLVLYTDTFEYAMTTETNKMIASVPSFQRTHAFSFYPNPARDIVHIRTEGNDVITVTDGGGKVLLSKTVNESDVINVSRFTFGTYYLQNKATGEVKKMVVVH